jgi:hypothetical protein
METSDDDERIPRIAASSITPREFEARFLAANRPCILTGLGVGWRACSEWADAGRAAIFEPLRERFGGEEVTVHDCSRTVLGRYRTSEMRLDDLLDLWARGEGSSLYLKDWNLAMMEADPSDRNGSEWYATPAHFARDWLNGFAHATEQVSDHRFCYVGRAGTFTPLHTDGEPLFLRYLTVPWPWP